MKKRFMVIFSWGILHLSLMIFPLIGSSQRQPSIPEAKYKVRLERSVMVPMRDGTKLSTDLYFPVGAGEKLPVILIRTPYNKIIWRAGEAKVISWLYKTVEESSNLRENTESALLKPPMAMTQ